VERDPTTVLVDNVTVSSYMGKMVKEQKIKNAVILAPAGPVRNFHVYSVTNWTFPSKDTFVRDPAAPVDVVSMNGYVANGEVCP
jgi:hypothetical protein